jgi:hypothetical protein
MYKYFPCHSTVRNFWTNNPDKCKMWGFCDSGDKDSCLLEYHMVSIGNQSPSISMALRSSNTSQCNIPEDLNLHRMVAWYHQLLHQSLTNITLYCYIFQLCVRKRRFPNSFYTWGEWYRASLFNEWTKTNLMQLHMLRTTTTTSAAPTAHHAE